MKALTVGLVLLAAVPSFAATPQISFEPGAVLARGINPKGQALWFSVAREISILDPERLEFAMARIGP